MLAPTSSNTSKIPVVAVGQSRVNAEAISGIFAHTSYTLAGILDTVSPPPYNFTPSNLAVTLRALHPRPRAIIVGEAISSQDSQDAVKVWKEYVEELKVESAFLVDLQHDEKGRSIEEIAKIPKDVLIEELIRRFDEHFRNQEPIVQPGNLTMDVLDGKLG